MKERQRWQPEEDALLRSYAKQYGPKEWHLLPQRMGKPLHRDPKSCLERWKNYLKPGIKKGSLTPEEQSLIISLQAKYGNKWKKIASELPGRTPKRLGKWWEVFKDKQLKAASAAAHRTASAPAPAPAPAVHQFLSSSSDSAHSQYDHILHTFAEKYVLPPAPMPGAPVEPPPPPILSLASGPSSSSTSLPPWLPSSSCSSSTTASPSVSLTLSPAEPPLAAAPQHQAAVVVQYCKEVEEARLGWLQQRKEAAWRLCRLEQQLEAEKARKKREKAEEVEAKIRALREEERAYLEELESECREQLGAVRRDADAKETKLAEAWAASHLRLLKLAEQISGSGAASNNLHIPRH